MYILVKSITSMAIVKTIDNHGHGYLVSKIYQAAYINSKEFPTSKYSLLQLISKDNHYKS